MISDDNLAKGKELQPWCQWAYSQFLNECLIQNLHFRVTEVYRTQERQNDRYAQGRLTPGPIVTWTHTSLHTKRLAFDIQVIDCTYEQVEKIANEYGIYRPADLVKLGDVGHLQTDKCVQEPFKIDPAVVARRFQRLIHWATSSLQKTRLQERLTQFLKQE